MDTFEKYLNHAIQFLARRPRSSKEVRDNLKKKKAPEDIIERVIQKLEEQKFLSDEEFARWWIEQRLRFRPKGIPMLKMELRQKGMSNSIIEQVMESSEEIDEVESAKKLLAKKFKSYRHMPQEDVYQKLGAFLARRGFNWEVIRQSIDALYKEEYNQHEKQ